MDQNQESQIPNIPAKKLRHRMPLPKNRKTLVIIASVLLALGILTGLVYSYFTFLYNAPPSGQYAVLGGQKITNSQFKEIYNAYLKFDESNAKSGAKVDKKRVERKVADEVLLRLSLQAEAEKRNAQKCTDEVINSRLKSRFEEAGGEQDYYDKLQNQYGWTREVTKHKECLDFYEETLAKSLIGSVDLYGIYIRWDIAKGAQNQPADIQQKVDDYAKKRLETEYLPMFERGDTEKQISSKADIDPETVTQQQFDERVLNIDRSPSRVIVLPQMNRATYSEFQQYEEGESELPYFENLKVGENTKPFKSKTGYWVIYRATGRTDAPYQSLEAMRADYIKKGKVAKSYFRLPEPVKPKNEDDPTRNFSLSVADKIMNTLVPKANAVTENSVRCFTGGTIHNLPMTIQYIDKATNSNIQTSGAYPGPEMFSTTNVQYPCSDEPDPAAYAKYGVLVEYYLGAVAIKPAAIPAPTWNFGLSCYTGWDFRFKAPNGYEPLSVADYKDANRFYLSLQYATSTTNGYYASGSTKVDEGLYRIPTNLYSGIANGAKGFTIKVYFTKTPVNTNGTLRTTKMFFGDSADSDKLASNKTLTKGQSISSPNGRYVARMQDDGNFVTYDRAYNKAFFQTCTYSNNPCSRGVGSYAGMTADGRFAIFDSSGNVVVNNTPQGTAGSQLFLQDDGNLAIWSSDHTTNTGTGTYYWTSGWDRPDGIAQQFVPDPIKNMNLQYVDFNSTNVVYQGTANPYTVTTMVQADGYKVKFNVPTGYKLVSAFGSNTDGSQANGSSSNISCTGTNNTGTCTKSGINIRTGETFNLDLVFQIDVRGGTNDLCNTRYKDTLDSPPTNNFFKDRNVVKSELTEKAWGWIYDPTLTHVPSDATKTPSNVRIVIDEGTSSQATVVKLADRNRPDVDVAYTGSSTVYDIGPYHGYVADLPDEVFDGNSHKARLYIEKDVGNGTILSYVDSLDFTCPKRFYPWLQTLDGNVVADGRIIGQKTSSGTNFPGARLSSSANKEAEFLIISAAGGDGPFCSTYNYILTNLYATDDGDASQCKNGLGYVFNYTGVDSSGVDRVVGGVRQALADNPVPSGQSCSQAKIATVTATSLPATLTTDCTGGLIYKLPAGSLGAATVDKGRITIFVDGNLEINGNILYGTTAQSDPRLTPNLAIVVNGDVNIRSDVTGIGAQIYASGKINTCAKNSSGATATINDCSASQLGVYGGMASKAGYDFRRTYVNETSRPSAEQIRLSGQAFTLPPPGIETRYFYDDFDGYSLDSSEFDPRF